MNKTKKNLTNQPSQQKKKTKTNKQKKTPKTQQQQNKISKCPRLTGLKQHHGAIGTPARSLRLSIPSIPQAAINPPLIDSHWTARPASAGMREDPGAACRRDVFLHLCWGCDMIHSDSFTPWDLSSLNKSDLSMLRKNWGEAGRHVECFSKLLSCGWNTLLHQGYAASVGGPWGPPGLRVAVGQRGVAVAAPSQPTPANNPGAGFRGLYTANTLSTNWSSW